MSVFCSRNLTGTVDWFLPSASALMLAACNNSVDQEADNGVSVSSDEETAVRSGPFGLEMGQPIDELDIDPVLENAGAGEEGLYVLDSVPKPMSQLESYAVVAYPSTGICEIRTISREFVSDSQGHNVRAAINALAEVIDSKYGDHIHRNRCTDNFCEFFQQNLRKGTQEFSYEWSTTSEAELPDSIGLVSLSARPGEYNNTFFRLDYFSSELGACDAAKNTSMADAL